MRLHEAKHILKKRGYRLVESSFPFTATEIKKAIMNYIREESQYYDEDDYESAYSVRPDATVDVKETRNGFTIYLHDEDEITYYITFRGEKMQILCTIFKGVKHYGPEIYVNPTIDDIIDFISDSFNPDDI